MEAEIIEFVGDRSNNTFVLHGEKLVMGLGSSADICTVAEKFSERQHALLELKNGKWCITDNFSITGVFMDGTKLHPMEATTLESGCRITFGPPTLTTVTYEFHCKSVHAKSKRHSKKQKKSQKRETKSSDGSREQSSASESEDSEYLPLKTRVALRLAKTASYDALRKEDDICVSGPSSKKTKPSTSKRRSLAQLCEFDDETKSMIVAIPQKRLLELESCERKCAKLEKELDGQKLKMKEMIEKELSCSICFEVYNEAITTSCGHSFCQLCLSSWRSHNSTCPVCRGAIWQGTYRTLAIDSAVATLQKIGGDCNKENKKSPRKTRTTKARSKKAKSSKEVITLDSSP